MRRFYRGAETRIPLRGGLGSLALVLMLSLLSTWSQAAARVDDLYSAVVKGDASAQPSPSELHQALAQVLVKVSGRSDVVNMPQSGTLFDNAALLLQPGQDPAAANVGAGQRRLTFAAKQLTELMHNLGLPVIGEQRPELLFWVVRDGGSPDFLASPSPLLTQVEQVADGRGVPLRLPLLDLTDQMTLSAADAARLAVNPIQQASSRYKPDAVLVASEQAGATQWMLLSGGQRYNFQTTDSSQVPQVINQVANRLLNGQGGAPVSQPIVVGDFSAPGIALTIDGVQTASDYLTLTGWLRGQDGVTSVVTDSSDGSTLELRVQIDGDDPALTSLLAGYPRLVSEGQDHYQWTAAQ